MPNDFASQANRSFFTLFLHKIEDSDYNNLILQFEVIYLILRVS